jgi:mycofactocin glycosyltransferase
MVLADGTLLVGGSPLRLIKLSPDGARRVADWFTSGEPISEPPSGLARRLLDAGMAHPVPTAGTGPSPGDVTVVIPVLDRAAELARCLHGLAGLRVIVVDDGSADPGAIERVVKSEGARVLRHDSNRGPAAARNAGLAAADTELVAFLDSDCVPEPGWLDQLLPHFGDPLIGAVAPRVVQYEAGRGWLARYEDVASPLDMGPSPALVRQGARVPYVPSAALVVRREAAAIGFSADMRVGEDVDFAWRLADAGWRIRYEPAATMRHEHRVRLGSWLRTRTFYGTSAADLEQRHPGSVRPLYVSPWTGAAWTAAIAGYPGVALAITDTASALLARKLAPVAGVAAGPLARRLAGGGTLGAGRPIGSALSRAWWPLALPAAVACPRLRLPLALLVLAPPVLDWRGNRGALSAPRYVATRLLDDAAYSVGVWRGCLRRRTIRPLLPTRSPRI